MEKRNDHKHDSELDSDVNTEGFTKPKGESQTIQEDPKTDPNDTDKPSFEKSDN
ncbi:hypothetical protein [Flavobacterium sp.]|uniref:hypothetical protein n=1 Tax=Flavobacterium sp. TaxID=239 RepID=UPI0025C2BB99|nr:hypothetical protein [Flavobacterium sp.]